MGRVGWRQSMVGGHTSAEARLKTPSLRSSTSYDGILLNCLRKSSQRLSFLANPRIGFRNEARFRGISEKTIL